MLFLSVQAGSAHRARLVSLFAVTYTAQDRSSSRISSESEGSLTVLRPAFATVSLALAAGLAATVPPGPICGVGLCTRPPLLSPAGETQSLDDEVRPHASTEAGGHEDAREPQQRTHAGLAVALHPRDLVS